MVWTLDPYKMSDALVLHESLECIFTAVLMCIVIVTVNPHLYIAGFIVAVTIVIVPLSHAVVRETEICII